MSEAAHETGPRAARDGRDRDATPVGQPLQRTGTVAGRVDDRGVPVAKHRPEGVE
jgi:hypothetical protein